MAKINLLPWRLEERARRNREFMVQMAGVILLALLGAFILWSYFNSQLSNQRQANSLVDQANNALDRDLKEIENLEKTREDIVSRMKVIQDLQGTRPLPVHVFDSMVRAMPPTLFLTEISRSGKTLTLKGRTDNPNTVSDLLRNLDLSPWMENSAVKEISNDLSVMAPAKPRNAENGIEIVAAPVVPEEKYISFTLTTDVVEPEAQSDKS